MVNLGIFLCVVFIAVFSIEDVRAGKPTIPLTCIVCSTDLALFNRTGIDPCSDKYISNYTALEADEARDFGVQNITCQPNELCYKDKNAIYTTVNKREKVWNENHTFYRRGCGYIPERRVSSRYTNWSYSDFCFNQQGVKGRIFNCFCDKDMCNDAFSAFDYKAYTISMLIITLLGATIYQLI